ncbi:MAG: polyprenol monophosphomannose synthase, partial [Ilumatobacteraceae bacterium]
SYGYYCVRFIYLAHKMGFPLKEVPYVCLVRRHGYSKTGTTLWGLIKRGLPYVALPIRIRRSSLT